MSDIYKVKKINHTINKEICLPGSKSITNRALVLSSLADGVSHLSNCLFSEDTIFMADALKELGTNIRIDKEQKSITIEGGKLPAGEHKLYVGNAGTTMRFLTSYLSLGNGSFIIDGSERMRERPISDLINALCELGANVTSVDNNGCPPLSIDANGINGGSCNIPGKNSSQYLSSLFMSLPYAKNASTVNIKGSLSSVPYIEMTEKMMSRYGINITNKNNKSFDIPLGKYEAIDLYIEPDASSATYFLGITAIMGGEVTIKGLGNSSIQGDSRFAKVLSMMGCEVNMENESIVLKSDGRLKGIDVDMNHMPDTVQTLAVIALFADSPTKIRNIYNLRIKECDRIDALSRELSKIGAHVNETEDSIEIIPASSYHAASIATYNDHRMAMAFSLAGLKIDGILIENPACVGKSFPDYFEYLEEFIK